MSLEQIRFSPRLLQEQHVKPSHRLTLRFWALVLTLGEVVVAYIMFRRTDFIGCYAMAAYLAKEHVIARFSGGK